MGMMDDDLAAIHADALGIGLASSCTYAGTAITATVQEIAQPYLHDEGGEVRRREAIMDVSYSDVASPAKDAAVVFASGVYAGTWHVVDIQAGDDAGWLLTIRFDDRTKMGTGRRIN
jgi:hypothetical protein